MRFKKIHLKRTKSTNDIAIMQIKKNKISPTIITSDIQSNGRGRQGKKWISLKGNLFMSIYFQIKKDLSLNEITKANCIIIKNAIKKIINKKLLIKHPNDILINKKKICGILQETLTHNSKKFLVVGIGINITKKPVIRNYLTGSLKEYTKKKLNKSRLFDLIEKGFREKYLNVLNR